MSDSEEEGEYSEEESDGEESEEGGEETSGEKGEGEGENAGEEEKKEVEPPPPPPPPGRFYGDHRIQLGLRIRPFFENEEEDYFRTTTMRECPLEVISKEIEIESKKMIEQRVQFKHPVTKKVSEFPHFDHIHWSHTPKAEEELARALEEKAAREEEKKQREEEDSEESEEEEGEGDSGGDVKAITPHIPDSLVFEETVKRLLDKVLVEHEDGVLLLYGSEYSGKTYTKHCILEEILNTFLAPPVLPGEEEAPAEVPSTQTQPPLPEKRTVKARMYELVKGAGVGGVRDLLDDGALLKVCKKNPEEVGFEGELKTVMLKDARNGKMVLDEGYSLKRGDSSVVIDMEVSGIVKIPKEKGGEGEGEGGDVEEKVQMENDPKSPGTEDSLSTSDDKVLMGNSFGESERLDVETKQVTNNLTIVKLHNSEKMDAGLMSLLTTVHDLHFNTLMVKRREDYDEFKRYVEEEEDSEEEDSEDEDDKQTVLPGLPKEPKEIVYNKSFLTWLLKPRLSTKSWITLYLLLNPCDWKVMLNDLTWVNAVKVNNIPPKPERKKKRKKVDEDEETDLE